MFAELPLKGLSVVEMAPIDCSLWVDYPESVDLSCFKVSDTVVWIPERGTSLYSSEGMKIGGTVLVLQEAVGYSDVVAFVENSQNKVLGIEERGCVESAIDVANLDSRVL